MAEITDKIGITGGQTKNKPLLYLDSNGIQAFDLSDMVIN